MGVSSHTAKRTTHLSLPRHARVAAAVFSLHLAACATTPVAAPSVSYAIDDSGREMTLGAFKGSVVVVDLCASWAAACNLNARVLDEVQTALAGEPVQVLTLLVDEGELAVQAQRSYADVLAVKHPVFIASEHVRSGQSALGDVSAIPRVVIFDKEGRIALDARGGIVNVEVLVEQVRALL
jgi:thiol-disulfide isomerase/thioredoxin